MEDLEHAYFAEHDVYGKDAEKGYQRRLRENSEAGIGPGDMEYHPTDDPKAMDDLTKSVKREGVREPLIVDWPNEGLQIPMVINGNHRYLAARRAGVATVPVRGKGWGHEPPRPQ